MINQLRDLRKNKFLSCAEVGRLMKKTPENIAQYEKSLKELSFNDAYILSRIYGITLDELYEASRKESNKYMIR